MAGDSMESNFVSMKAAVEFLDVQDQYSYNEDLQCSYKFNDYTPQEGDRVAIYKLGWNLVKDYVLFEWVPFDRKNEKNSATFSKHVLPKNDNEIYQICYISGENVLHGASSPFQFASEITPVMIQSCASSATTGIDVCDRTNMLDTTGEFKKLKEENEMLREALKAVIAQKSGRELKNYDSEISDLRRITTSLSDILSQQQVEVNMLKEKIQSGGEEYKKLYLEKAKIERKYDKLKSKVGGSEKVVAELINFDIDDLKSIPPFPFSK